VCFLWFPRPITSDLLGFFKNRFIKLSKNNGNVLFSIVKFKINKITAKTLPSTWASGGQQYCLGLSFYRLLNLPVNGKKMVKMKDPNFSLLSSIGCAKLSP
jgi:hypothetical protein